MAYRSRNSATVDVGSLLLNLLELKKYMYCLMKKRKIIHEILFDFSYLKLTKIKENPKYIM